MSVGLDITAHDAYSIKNAQQPNVPTVHEDTPGQGGACNGLVDISKAFRMRSKNVDFFAVLLLIFINRRGFGSFRSLENTSSVF